MKEVTSPEEDNVNVYKGVGHRIRSRQVGEVLDRPNIVKEGSERFGFHFSTGQVWDLSGVISRQTGLVSLDHVNMSGSRSCIIPFGHWSLFFVSYL